MPPVCVKGVGDLAQNSKGTYSQRFEKGFRLLTAHRSPYEVWADLMYLFAVEISNTATRNVECLQGVWEQREKEYKRIAKKYDTRERTRIIPQMFTLMVMELDREPNQDFLGKMYMGLGIGNKNAGQFFTPYSLCEAMSVITIDKRVLAKTVKEVGYVSVYDPACGAGATLVSAVNLCKQLFKRLNFQNHVWFAAQDVDATVSYMCYIQLSLLGVAGIVKIGNTLTDPEFVVTKETAGQYFFTPMWFSPVWETRRALHGLDIAMNKMRKGGDGNGGKAVVQKASKP